jgi:ribosomal protein S1
MTPPVPKEDDLSREIEKALEGVNLQELGEGGRAAPRGPSKGDRLFEGVVAGVHGDDVIVDLGPRMQGVVSLREFDEPPTVGDRHRFLLRGREEELWLLSLRDAKELASWEDLAPGAHVKARVSGQNRGGLELKIGSHDAFMPASQVALGRQEDLAGFIGQTLVCEVLEIDRERNRVLLSRRSVLERERAEERKESLGKLHPGLVLKGKVTRIEAFGAFVDVGGGLEGLVHVSNLSRKRIQVPADHVTIGQEVEVQVLDIKDGGKRIGLGMKQLEPDPWVGIADRLGTDSVHNGLVTRLTEFGAFVEIEPGIEGLVHVSQFGKERVRRPSDVTKVGERFPVRVLSVSPTEQRISLSRLDPRGAVLGSEDSVESNVIDEVLSSHQGEKPVGTNLGALFQKALSAKKKA